MKNAGSLCEADRQLLEELRRIAGEVDGSGGENGSVVAVGRVADALVDSFGLSDSFLSALRGRPVRVRRSGGLEIWVNGFYIEGRGVRAVVAKAIDLLESDGTSAAELEAVEGSR